MSSGHLCGSLQTSDTVIKNKWCGYQKVEGGGLDATVILCKLTENQNIDKQTDTSIQRQGWFHATHPIKNKSGEGNQLLHKTNMISTHTPQSIT